MAQTLERFRVSYGGYNETATPMWVGIDKGIFRKYGIDASMIQVRSGALSVAALIAKQKGLSHPAIDAQVALVDERLGANRKKAAAA